MWDMMDTLRSKWSNLSPRGRGLIAVLAIVDTALKAVALRDVASRSADEVVGNKRLWALGLTFVNSAGVLPLVYFVKGRR